MNDEQMIWEAYTNIGIHINCKVHDIHHTEKLVEAEALAEWNAYNKCVPSYDLN